MFSKQIYSKFIKKRKIMILEKKKKNLFVILIVDDAKNQKFSSLS